MSKQQQKNYSARDAATKIVALLQNAGHEAYFAGGCVRDRLLGVDAIDYDVATDALPERVCELFNNAQYIGEAFGVVLVRLLGHSVEVATFRLEWGYEDGRHPTSVDFTDAQHDATRRDFTINGLFENPLAEDKDAQIIDYVNGKADLAGEVIRAIGDPDERFAEDYLRMLRAVRFAARLDFEIELATIGAICRQAKNLAKISRERIGQEVRLMLTGCGGATAIKLLQQLLLDGPALGEEHLDVPVGSVERLEHSLMAMIESGDYVDRQGKLHAMMLAGWMFDRFVRQTLTATASVEEVTKALQEFAEERGSEVIKRWRKNLCLTNEEYGYLYSLPGLLVEALSWRELTVARRKRLLAGGLWREVYALIKALGDIEVVGGLVDEIAGQAEVLFADGVCPPPWVTGDDLIGLGMSPGPDFKRILDCVYDAQLENRVTDKDQAVELVRGLT